MKREKIIVEEADFKNELIFTKGLMELLMFWSGAIVLLLICILLVIVLFLIK